MLKVNSKVFYPAHGAGWVRGMKQIEFGGETKKYYEFEFINKSLTISTPVENIDNLGIRPVAEPKKIRTQIKALKAKTKEKPPTKDYNSFIEMIKRKDMEANVSSFLEIIQYCNYIKTIRVKEGRLIPVTINKYIKNSVANIISELAVAENSSYEKAQIDFVKITGFEE